MCRALSEEKAAWKKPEFTATLTQQANDWESWQETWLMFTRLAADAVLARYVKAVQRYREEGDLCQA